MNKERETKKQQMILIVSIFLAVIIVAWVASLGWSLFNIDKAEGDGTVKDMVGGIEQSIASFSDNVSDKKVDFSNVVESLKDRFNEEKEAVDSITDSMMDKLTTIKMDSWSEHLDEMIYFKYPAEWLLNIEDSVISLQEDEISVLTITVYKDVSDLPDNINSLDLEPWLDEQIDRELGVFTGYELEDNNINIDMYKVSRKDDLQTEDIYWQNELGIYHMNYVLDSLQDRVIKLIISTIK